MKKKKISKGIIAFIVILILLLVALGMLSKKTDPLADLPNYTEIDGNFDVKEIKYDEQPMLGSKSAPVKVVEFGDFKCPSCKNWTLTNFEKLKKDYIDTGKIQFYYMNYAFIDRDSILAASAGEAIAKQNNEKFWEFYHKLYQNQGDETKIWATEKYLLNFVKKNISGIDYNLFKKDLNEGTYLFDVKEDFKTGGYLGVNGTPTFFVNGEKVNAKGYEELTQIIDQAYQSE